MSLEHEGVRYQEVPDGTTDACRNCAFEEGFACGTPGDRRPTWARGCGEHRVHFVKVVEPTTGQHARGVKLDAGKVRVGLVFRGFPRALLRVAAVATYGANKYTPDGWQSVADGIDRYDDAKGRHLLAGYIEPADVESDIEHQAHEAWNALARLELLLRKKEQGA